MSTQWFTYHNTNPSTNVILLVFATTLVPHCTNPCLWQHRRDWLSDVGTGAHIISSLQRVLPVRDSRDLLTPLHRLFSGNHFVYTAGICCPRNPRVTALSKVNMQHLEAFFPLHQLCLAFTKLPIHQCYKYQW